MASATTQSIGPAVAPLYSSNAVNPATAPRDQAASGQQGTAAVIQASQAASQQATTSARREDKERSTQVPKRTEASFAPQSRPKSTQQVVGDTDPAEGSKSEDDTLDVVA
jgi:hypothetical protein